MGTLQFDKQWLRAMVFHLGSTLFNLQSFKKLGLGPTLRIPDLVVLGYSERMEVS